MSTTTERTDAAAVLAVLDEMHVAIGAGDAGRALETCAPDVVVFSLAPPLVQPAATREEAVAGLGAWIATFTAPPRLEHRDPTVHVVGDLAVVHTLTSMSAEAVEGQGTEGFTLWFRSTYVLNRVGGRWLIVHQHESVPFRMDGSLLASVDLEP